MPICISKLLLTSGRLGGGRKHNINVFEKTKENYLRLFEYVEAQTNVLDVYNTHIHIKKIQSWIKQETQSKLGIMNMLIQR